MIGEEAFVGKGFGKAIVGALTQQMLALPAARRIIVQPDMENLPSCRSLLANGYVFDEQNQHYRLDK